MASHKARSHWVYARVIATKILIASTDFCVSGETVSPKCLDAQAKEPKARITAFLSY